MIQVKGLKKLYDEHLAVDGVSFDLGRGQVCGLVGPNGAGKTTTMRCLAGLIPATSGWMRVAEQDMSGDLIELKRRLAYVPDDPPLFDDLTVEQHLDLIGRLYQVEHHADKASELLEYFQLSEKFDAGAATLSRGMRQKLAICCAYLFSPDVLLLDEPLTGLDPPGIRSLLESVVQRAEAGATVIISSHLLAMIEDVCSHLLVMQVGRAQYFGAADRLRKQYPNASTLEEAYFAATQSDDGAPQTGDVAEQMDQDAEAIMPLITLPIAQYRDGATS